MKESDLKKSPLDIPWSNDPGKVNYNRIFFDNFFPDLSGKAKVTDKFFYDVQAPMYATFKNDNIKFDRPDDEDPDHLVSVSYISYMMHTIIRASSPIF